MATRTEQTVVYAAGVVQGIALVTFPAASTILTDPSEYDLSSTQYGALFLPQVVTAITAALLGASLGNRLGTKRVYLIGLVCGLVSMGLLIVSSFVTDRQQLAYVLLLLATASLGAGFGFTVPALKAAAVAGGVIAFYQLGYGIAAFGTGPLVDGGVSLSTIYGIAAAVAAAMGLWSFVVAGRRPSPATLHPQPG